jgi:hypothetical protein
MGTANAEHKSVETEYASKKEIDLANQIYETDLGLLSQNLKGVKLKHYKDPNGFFVVTKEEMKLVEQYIPIMAGNSINGVSNPNVTITSKSLSLDANGQTYLWNAWYTASASANEGISSQYITDYKIVAIKYQDSAGKLITPDGYLLGQVGFGIRQK